MIHEIGRVTKEVERKSRVIGEDFEGNPEFERYNYLSEISIPDNVYAGTKVDVIIMEHKEPPEWASEYNDLMADLFTMACQPREIAVKWSFRLQEVFEKAYDTQRAINKALDDVCAGCWRWDEDE